MRKPTKFGSKEGIEKGNKEWGKVPKRDPRVRNRGKGVSSLRGILRSMQEMSRVLKGRLLLEYVMVVVRETTYGGLAPCEVPNRIDLSLMEVPNNIR